MGCTDCSFLDPPLDTRSVSLLIDLPKLPLDLRNDTDDKVGHIRERNEGRNEGREEGVRQRRKGRRRKEGGRHGRKGEKEGR